ncbi:phage tail protein [Solihabitans fulvus]|uniref:Phage tail protein n=1 Tax=Solihabitans fulvus TaxID=1892852 RepID=A0A5B2X6D5_9PSEU|nr:phage tail protein [Solihabitans fulvus]KAA2258793.1 phage tail protein [Solihabitans fulvus]
MPISSDTMIGLVNRFQVTLDDGKIDLGSWSKVDGLNVKWDVAEYRTGDQGNERYFFPGATQYEVIKLTRAACADTMKVKEYLSNNSFKAKAMTGHIKLCDAANKEVAHWDLTRTVPMRWAITAFDSSASSVATETLELHHAGFLDDQVQH